MCPWDPYQSIGKGLNSGWSAASQGPFNFTMARSAVRPGHLSSLTNIITPNIHNDMSGMSELIPLYDMSEISQDLGLYDGPQIARFWKLF